MIEHYVTLFDSAYLPQGLSLHASLQRHAGAHLLWVVCMDERCFSVLSRLALPNTRLLRVDDHLDAATKAVRAQRTAGEFCWTMTPQVYDFVFPLDASIVRLTYLDADVWFRKSPRRIFRELDVSGKAVLITDHGYAPEYDQSAASGQYCVQFLTFYRSGAESVRERWRSQCLEWCFNRVEDGKFGDQKYLDDWPDRFDGLVHVLADHGLTLAPWNASRFPYGNAVLWHFHGLKLKRAADSSNYDLDIGGAYYVIPNVVRQHVYGPYIDDLKAALGLLERIA